MSKIAEQKALQAYPYLNEERRKIYVNGYDQCLNDFKEFLFGRFYIHPHDCHVVQYVSDKPLDGIDNLVEEFSRYVLE